MVEWNTGMTFDTSKSKLCGSYVMYVVVIVFNKIYHVLQ